MKILYVTSSFGGGGITTYAHEVVKCFLHDNDISVVIGTDEKSPFDRSKVSVYNCDVSDLSISNAQYLLKLINEEIKPDLIVNSNALLMSLVSPYVDDAIRIISVSHSLRYNEADVAGFNSPYVDTLIALSVHAGNYLRSHYKIKDSNKIKVVCNFVNENPDANSIINQKKRAKILKIVFAGGTSAAKSPELVFDILQELQKTDLPFEFYFMGANSPTLKKIQRYRSVQELIPQDSRITFTGRIPHEEANAMIELSNVFLVPSRREGCPMAMLEAISTGAIVITSDYKNACREMITDGKEGFVINHKHVDEFVARIKDIILHHDKYIDMYEASYNNYLRNFSAEPWRKRMLEIINTADGSHSQRFKSFDETKYKRDLRKIQFRKKYNALHMLFFETLKSAVPFYVKYLSK